MTLNFLKELAAFSSIQPINSGSNARLTNTQKSVLLSIFAAPTPETAYDATTGSENVTQAKQQLRSMGLINVDDNSSRAGVTDAGQQALVNNNLIDEMGQLTDDGNETLEQQQQIKNEFENATESILYPILKTLI